MASFLKKLVEHRSKSPQKRTQEQESFGIHSWNTEPREIDDVFYPPKSPEMPAPGPLMRTRSHSPRKLRRETNEERKLKSKSKSPQKSTVINQLDYLNSQCHLEGCQAYIVVTSTRFMLCRHQLCHASVFFKDLLSGGSKESNKDYYVNVSNLSDPTPSTQFRWFVESCIPCPALKDISDETLETCMRLSQRFQAKGLELRCMKYLIENAHARQPIVALCWLNWALKHNFDAQTHAALLPSVSRLSLNALQRHRHMITEHIYSDIITAKLRATYDKTVQVFLAIHKIDHFTADLDICPRCKRTKDGMKIKVHCDPCRKQVGCDRCYQAGCEISMREDLQAFFKCPHGMTPINDTTDDCHCQIPHMAQYLGNTPTMRFQENNDEYMIPNDQLTKMERKSRKKQQKRSEDQFQK
uniref:BTB domain-containing protein n=2 Tax=Caenorhabditis tropicalis TaxID=1561998 RepID=A0A1I7UMC1_9PELO